MDVTGRMQAGASPRVAELERFRAAMDAVDAAVLLLDRDAMRYLDANAAARTLTGLGAEALAASGPDALAASPAEAAARRAAYAALAPGATTAATDETWRRADGAAVPVRVERRLAGGAHGAVVVELVRARAVAA
jgi:PAS domain S-box-containing protein